MITTRPRPRSSWRGGRDPLGRDGRRHLALPRSASLSRSLARSLARSPRSLALARLARSLARLRSLALPRSLALAVRSLSLCLARSPSLALRSSRSSPLARSLSLARSLASLARSARSLLARSFRGHARRHSPYPAGLGPPVPVSLPVFLPVSLPFPGRFRAFFWLCWALLGFAGLSGLCWALLGFAGLCKASKAQQSSRFNFASHGETLGLVGQLRHTRRLRTWGKVADQSAG